MDKQTIAELIELGLPGSQVSVSGDDGRHFHASIQYDGFVGKTKVQQHQMVYKTLGDHMREAIHALSIETYTGE